MVSPSCDTTTSTSSSRLDETLNLEEMKAKVLEMVRRGERSSDVWTQLLLCGWANRYCKSDHPNGASSVYLPPWNSSISSLTSTRVSVRTLTRNRDYFDTTDDIVHYISKYGLESTVKEPTPPKLNHRSRKADQLAIKSLNIPSAVKIIDQAQSKCSTKLKARKSLPILSKDQLKSTASSNQFDYTWSVAKKVKFFLDRGNRTSYPFNGVWDCLSADGWKVAWLDSYESVYVPNWNPDTNTLNKSTKYNIDNKIKFIDYFSSKEEVLAYIRLQPSLGKITDDTIICQLTEDFADDKPRNSRRELNTSASSNFATSTVTDNAFKRRKPNAQVDSKYSSSSSRSSKLKVKGSLRLDDSVQNSSAVDDEFYVNPVPDYRYNTSSRGLQEFNEYVYREIEKSQADSPLASEHSPLINACNEDDLYWQQTASIPTTQECNEIVTTECEEVSILDETPQLPSTRAVFDDAITFYTYNDHLASVVGRDEEQQLLKDTIVDCLSSGKGHNILIHGQPGQGKSHLVHTVLRKVMAMENELPPFNYVKIQGTCVSSTSDVYREIATALNLEVTSGHTLARTVLDWVVSEPIKKSRSEYEAHVDLTSAMRKKLKTRADLKVPMTLLIMEEIGGVAVNAVRELMCEPIFRREFNSLILIGIFNNRVFYDELGLDQKMFSKLDITVNSIEQLQNIARYYLSNLATESAIQYLASKVSRNDQCTVI